MRKITRRTGYELNDKTGFGRAYLGFSSIPLITNLLFVACLFTESSLLPIMLVLNIFASIVFLVGIFTAEAVRYSLIQKVHKKYL